MVVVLQSVDGHHVRHLEATLDFRVVLKEMEHSLQVGLFQMGGNEIGEYLYHVFVPQVH